MDSNIANRNYSAKMQNQNSLKRKDNATEIEQVYLSDSEPVYVEGYYGAAAATEGNEKQQLYKFFATLRKYWLIILAINLLATAAVIIYEAQKPDYYKADVRIQINNEMNPASGSGSGSFIFIPGNDPTYFTTQLQIIEGSGLLRRVVKTLDLEYNPAFFNSNRGRELTVWQNVLRMFQLYKPTPAQNNTGNQNALQNKLTLKKDSGLDLDNQAEQLAPYVDYLGNSLNVAPVRDSRTANKDTRLIEVEFTHYDPTIAAKVANAIADTYVLQNLEQKVQTNAAAGDFLQKRVAELQSQIRLGEERLINYGKSNQILSLDSSQNTVVQRLSDLNGKLGQAENDRITAEAAYRAAVQNPMTNEIVQSKDGRTSGLEGQLTTLRQRLDQLKTEYTEEWWEVVQVRRQIAGIEKELQVTRKLATNTSLGTLEQAFREAAARERELRNNFDKQRADVLKQNEAAINYRIIQQEIDTNKTLLDGLLVKSRETEVILNGTPNNVHIVDRALTPRSPAGPQRAKNILVVFMASLAAGIGLAFLLGWLNDTIRYSDDLEPQLGLPVLGMIPMIPAAYSGFAQKLLPARLATKKGRKLGKNVYNLDSFEKPVIAEAYHQLRTSLLLSTAGGPAQTILITSGQGGEGKTVTSLNLAKSLAQIGAKVLLIDADLRCPKLHTINDISNKTGLTSLLTTKNINQELIDDVIQKDPRGGLHILTAGPHTPNPANLLSSEQMRDLLKNLSSQYSHILVDSPPVLYFADSSILSTYVDAVVLIARNNVTSQQTVLQAKKRLLDVHAKVIGIVVNDIPLNSQQYYNYDYYQESSTKAVEEDHGMLGIN